MRNLRNSAGPTHESPSTEPGIAAAAPGVARTHSVVFSLTAAVGAAIGWSTVATAQSPPIAEIVVTAAARRERTRSTCRRRSTASTATDIREAACRSTSPRASAAFPGCSRATGRTTRRTCRSRSAASARARPSACAACASTSTASRRRCPTARARSRNVDLGSADRIEVLRGPFSALYGNSSGGVIQVFTEDGRRPAHAHARASAGGSYGAAALGVKASGVDRRARLRRRARAISRPTAIATTARPSATSATRKLDLEAGRREQADARREHASTCRRRRIRSA